jgi:DNA-binding GntR family transcriptional regulator
MPILSDPPQRISGVIPSASPIVAAAFERIMLQIQSGALPPGTPIKDVQIAAEFGVSRTPVREAISLLRDVGVLEVSASRFTRVAMSTPMRTRQASNVWFPLHSMLVRELVAAAPFDSVTIANLERLQAVTVEAVADHDISRFYTASARFYDVLLGIADNPPLQRATASVVHAFRLGLTSLGEAIEAHSVVASQRLLIDALRDGDSDAAERSLDRLQSIVIPVP